MFSDSFHHSYFYLVVSDTFSHVPNMHKHFVSFRKILVRHVEIFLEKLYRVKITPTKFKPSWQ